MARFQSLTELLETSAATWADRELFGEKQSGGWEYITYGQFRQQVAAFRAALADLGVEPGRRVAIVSNNRVEWAVAAYATYGRGAAFVPMYEAQAAEEWEFILGDCEAKVAIGATRSIHDRLAAMKPRLSALEHVIGLDLPDTHCASYAALLERGAERTVEPIFPSGGDIAGLIYTSGTTGKPKGVKLSHHNICSNVIAVQKIFPFEPDERSLSFLPWAHSFGQTCELHAMVSMGCSMAINDEVENLIDNLADVKPTILFAVPRIFDRIYEGVYNQMADRPAIIRGLFDRGIKAAVRKNRGGSPGSFGSINFALADKLIFSRIRQRFGGRLKYVVSGSAALSREVAGFIEALGIEVYEGYGLTETSPIVTANYPGHRKAGSVGKPIPGVTIKIDKMASSNADDESGEIIVYGPNVMRGYHNRPEENDEVVQRDGGLRTGDLGYVDADGYLYITGRIKEQYKLDSGKYVAPAPVEEALTLSPLIASAMVYGDNRPYTVTLIVADLQEIGKWADKEGIDLPDDPASQPQVRELLEREIEARTAGFKRYERPRKFVVITDDFTAENGMLTPTLKLKRHKVLAEYGDQLERLYSSGDDE